MGHEMAALDRATIEEIVRTSRATGTQQSYGRLIRQYEEWLTQYPRLQADSPQVRNLYLCYCWEQKKFKTMGQVSAALSWQYGTLASEEREVANLILESARREATPVVHREKITEREVWDMVEKAGESDTGLRLSVFLLMGFYGMLRVSELCSLQWEDIVEANSHIVILLRCSKTDQQRKGARVKVEWETESRERNILSQWKRRAKVSKVGENKSNFSLWQVV